MKNLLEKIDGYYILITFLIIFIVTGIIGIVVITTTSNEQGSTVIKQYEITCSQPDFHIVTDNLQTYNFGKQYSTKDEAGNLILLPVDRCIVQEVKTR